MFKRLALAVALLAAFLSGALAQGTLKPKATLNAEVLQQLPDNTSGLIAPSNARTVVSDVIASFQQAATVNAQVGTSYSVLAADFGKLVTLNNANPITVTLPQPTGAIVNMNVYVANIGAGAAAVSATGATINGSASQNLNGGSFMWFVSDATGTNYAMIQNGTQIPANTILPSMLTTSAVPYGTPCLNCTLTASVGSSALTVAVKTLAGTDPTVADPAYFLIPTTTGSFTVITQTAALSLTVPSTATIGTVNNQANRLWVGVFNNAGTAVIGVYNSLNSTGPSIVPWDETSQPTTISVVGGSNNSQTWYASSAITKSFRTLGLVESTQVTAGTWATAPSKVMLMGPGVKKPGEVVQEISTPYAASTSVSSATFALFGTAQNVSITLTSQANVVRVEATGAANVVAGGQGAVRLSNGSSNNTNMIGTESGLSNFATGASSASIFGFYCRALNIPNASSVTYNLQGFTGTAVAITTVTPVEVSAKEIQI